MRTSSLRLLYYIYRGDASGDQVRAALDRALGRGVEVALLVDGFGYAAPEHYFADLVAKGLRFCRFHPTFGRRYLIRNHQKLALADDARVLIGGFNIEDSYFSTPEAGAWRDLGLLIDGPAAARLGRYFDQLMAWARTRRGKIRHLNRIVHLHSESQGIAAMDLRRPDARAFAMGHRDLPRPAPRARRRDDRGLFLPDLGDAAAHLARRRPRPRADHHRGAVGQ